MSLIRLLDDAGGELLDPRIGLDGYVSCECAQPDLEVIGAEFERADPSTLADPFGPVIERFAERAPLRTITGART